MQRPFSGKVKILKNIREKLKNEGLQGLYQKTWKKLAKNIFLTFKWDEIINFTLNLSLSVKSFLICKKFKILKFSKIFWKLIYFTQFFKVT